MAAPPSQPSQPGAATAPASRRRSNVPLVNNRFGRPADLAARVPLDALPRDIVTRVIDYLRPGDLRNVVYATARETTYQWIGEYLKDNNAPWTEAKRNERKDFRATLMATRLPWKERQAKLQSMVQEVTAVGVLAIESTPGLC
jgi:hypothetical protein